MATRSPNLVLHGVEAPPQELHALRAGRLYAELDGVDLRYVRDGGHELIRRVYAAVRDPDWGTVPATISAFELREDEASFALTFSARHDSATGSFSWNGRVIGEPEGRIVFTLDGVADTDLQYARIGFCVLHPAGQGEVATLRGRGPEGALFGELPELVAPQRFEHDVYVPMFGPVSELVAETVSGGGVRLVFEGDLFEVEDQRNWTDASFKTYSTPMALGYPHTLRAGQRLRQSIDLSPAGDPPDRAWPEGPIRVEVGDPVGIVPPVGLAIAEAPAPAAHELEVLRTIAPAHLRGTLNLDRDWRGELELIRWTAVPLGTPVELALSVQASHPEQLDELRSELEGLEIARVLVFASGAQTATPNETTPAQLAQLVRSRLRPKAPVFGGTDMEFCELNRTRPDARAFDGIAFSMVATVHADDDVSVAETTAAQGDSVRTARRFAAATPIAVTPISFRFRPTGVEAPAGPGPPPTVDPRQLSLFGAAWTVASLGTLARAGADSLTYFETIGWRGVVERGSGSWDPVGFPSTPGQVFPLAQPLADVCEWRGSLTLQVTTDRPFEVGVLATDEALLVANLTGHPRRVVIAPLHGSFGIRRLNAATSAQAGSDPRSFRTERTPLKAEGELRLELEPFETVRLDQVGADHPANGR